jgi:hypothetical protein
VQNRRAVADGIVKGLAEHGNSAITLGYLLRESSNIRQLTPSGSIYDGYIPRRRYWPEQAEPSHWFLRVKVDEAGLREGIGKAEVRLSRPFWTC